MALKKNIIWELTLKQFSENVIKANKLLDDQPGMKGTVNEKLLVEFLENFLPARFGIALESKVLDKEGYASKEQDIIIYDKINMPRIFSNDPVFLFETVYACIEVKTKLNNKNLEKAILNISHFKKLKHDAKFRNVEETRHKAVYLKGGLHKEDGLQIFTYQRQASVYDHVRNYPPINIIFSYDTNWKTFKVIIENIEKIIEKNNIQPENIFDYLYIMRKGIIGDWGDPRDFKRIHHTNGGTTQITDGIRFFPSMANETLKPKIRFRLGQIYQPAEKEKSFRDLSIDNQIIGMIEFLSVLNWGIQQQKKFSPFQIIQRSYTYDKFNIGGRLSKNLWEK